MNTFIRHYPYIIMFCNEVHLSAKQTHKHMHTRTNIKHTHTQTHAYTYTYQTHTHTHTALSLSYTRTQTHIQTHGMHINSTYNMHIIDLDIHKSINRHEAFREHRNLYACDL